MSVVGRLLGVQQWGTDVSSVLKWVLGFLLESSTSDRLERTICEDKRSVSGLFSVCLPVREQWGLLFPKRRWARSGRWLPVMGTGYGGVWNQIQRLPRDLKWEYLEMVSKTGLETSLQHICKSLAQETSYLQCKSKAHPGGRARDKRWRLVWLKSNFSKGWMLRTPCPMGRACRRRPQIIRFRMLRPVGALMPLYSTIFSLTARAEFWSVFVTQQKAT